MRKGFIEDQKEQYLNKFQSKLSSSNYKLKHVSFKGAFTRERKLTFQKVISLQLSKGLKSLQLRLNESFLMNKQPSVTASAYSQARQKYRHTAFIELSDFTRDFYYEEADFKRWRGYRLSAIDGSMIVLPNDSEVIKTFGSRALPGTKKIAFDKLPMDRLVASYDVLNHMVHNAHLAHSNSYEVEESTKLLNIFSSDDLLLSVVLKVRLQKVQSSLKIGVLGLRSVI